MEKDERDLLAVLKSELVFLESGGSSRPAGESWRPTYIFEDSPSCVNFGRADHRKPCAECVLIELVPAELREERIPCRFIPLTAWGDTLESLYRTCDQNEVGEVVKNWLRESISNLEDARKGTLKKDRQSQSADRAAQCGTSLHEDARPKCANPACPTSFHLLAGGKFFRFRPDATSESQDQDAAKGPNPSGGVKHYWLCEPCSHVFTLVYDEKFGVALKLLNLELPVGEATHRASAA